MSDTTDGGLRFLPVAIDVRGQDCVVVGGGTVGTRKALTLLEAGAAVTVIAPTASTELRAQIEAGRIRWLDEPFREERVEGADLVVAATDDEAVNELAVMAATRLGALVCDASSVDRSRLIFGALTRTDDVTIAVFSDGRDPGRAGRARDAIAELLARAKELKGRVANGDPPGGKESAP